MLLKVEPIDHLQGTCLIPSSKPETQRAILTASLAHGISKIYNDLRCLETDTMKNVCRSMGATIIEHKNHLEIQGIAGNLKFANEILDCKGSALVFRSFAALASVSKNPVILTGDSTLRPRVMKPLFDALKQLGANLACIVEEEHAPLVNWGNSLKGGVCTVPGNISSQFITALLFVSPFAKTTVKIHITGEIISKPYIMQTLVAMRAAGIHLTTSDSLNYIQIKPGQYHAITMHIAGDYTSASYFLAAAALFKGKLILENVNSNSLQGEKEIINIVQKLGLKIEFDDTINQVVISNFNDSLKGNYEFNVVDCPNILPTLATIGAYVEGTFRVIGGAVTQLHKSPRIEAIITELRKLGVNIKPIFVGDVYDGFEIKGKSSYMGNVEFSSWRDHRIFMSLFVASLRSKCPNYLRGYEDIHRLFPGFLNGFKRLGVNFEVIEKDI